MFRVRDPGLVRGAGAGGDVRGGGGGGGDHYLQHGEYLYVVSTLSIISTGDHQLPGHGAGGSRHQGDQEGLPQNILRLLLHLQGLHTPGHTSTFTFLLRYLWFG